MSPSLRSYPGFSQIPKKLESGFYGEGVLTDPPAYCPLPAIRDCLFNIFTATHRIQRPSPPPAAWETLISCVWKWYFVLDIWNSSGYGSVLDLWTRRWMFWLHIRGELFNQLNKELASYEIWTCRRTLIIRFIIELFPSPSCPVQFWDPSNFLSKDTIHSSFEVKAAGARTLPQAELSTTQQWLLIDFVHRPGLLKTPCFRYFPLQTSVEGHAKETPLLVHSVELLSNHGLGYGVQQSRFSFVRCCPSVRNKISFLKINKLKSNILIALMSVVCIIRINSSNWPFTLSMTISLWII